MILYFLIFLPIVFYLIKIQIFIGLLFFIWYSLIYITIKNVLNTEYTISCKEIPLNTSYLLQYAAFNLIFFVPKANAFLTFYNLLEFIKIKNEKKEFIKYFILFFIASLIFLIKASIFLLVGYSFLSVLTTSEFIIKVFYLQKLKYKSKKAKKQSFIINCFLNNIYSVGEAENKNLIIKQNEVIFNVKMKEIVLDFLSKVKKPELLFKAFSKNNEIIETNKVDNHFNFSISSKSDFSKNLTKNLTSSKNLKVFSIKSETSFNDNKDAELFECKDEFYPNLLSQNKSNFLTFPYELNKENSYVEELEDNKIILMQNFAKTAHNSIILDANQNVFISNNSIFYKNEKNITVREYANEYNIDLKNNIKYLDEFIEVNKKLFEDEDFRVQFQIIIEEFTNIKKKIIFVENDNSIFF